MPKIIANDVRLTVQVRCTRDKKNYQKYCKAEIRKGVRAFKAFTLAVYGEDQGEPR